MVGKPPEVFLSAWERLQILLIAIVGRVEKWLFIDQALCLPVYPPLKFKMNVRATFTPTTHDF